MMYFALSDEQEALRDSVAAMAAKLSSAEAVRAAMGADGFNHTLWRTVVDLGLTALALPDEYDGADAGLVELCIVQEQLGARTASIPYGSTVLAGLIIAEHSDSRVQRTLLPRIARGELKAAAHLPVGEPTLELVREGDATLVTGSVTPLIDGLIADAVLATVRSDHQVFVALIELDDATPRIELPRLDPTRSVATLTLDRTPAHIVADEASLALIRSSAATMLAAEQVGCARAALQMAVAYAGMREQFGRPIGSNQGIKHRCADMFVAAEAAWSATFYAAWVGANEPAAFHLAAAVARVVAADASASATASNIQVHGGIGFTWEHDAHLYAKRAKVSSLLLGDPHREMDPLAEYLLTEAADGGSYAWI